MKIRNGFVSNSSSSSFIFAIGEITNKEHLLKEFDGLKPSITDYISTKENLLSEWLYSGQKIYHDLSTGSYEFDLSQLEDGKEYLIINETGPDGDSYFSDNYFGDIDYDIDLSDYEPYQRTIFNIITSKDFGVKHIESHYQAGRDG